MTDGPVLYRRHDGIVTLTLNRPKTLSSDQTVPRNIPGVRVRAKTWLEREGRFALGEGGADLLGAIASRGLTLRSCSCRGWSYRHAWGYNSSCRGGPRGQAHRAPIGQRRSAWHDPEP